MAAWAFGKHCELPNGISKTIISEGVGTNKPASGDEVHVNFIGWIQANQEEFHRAKDFHFTLGADEVNRGLDIGVATMLQGEVAKLDMSPDFAYGAEGVPGKIPPSSSLTFDVKLLWWKPPGAVALTADGGILKTIQRPGAGPIPGAGSQVQLCCTMEGKQNMLEGEVGMLEMPQVPGRTLDICVASMLESEQAVVTLASPYVEASMTLELELLKVMVVQECSYFKEKTGDKHFPKITQKWLQDGAGGSKPTAMSTVTALVNGKSITWRLMLGDPAELEAAEAIECGLLNMTCGARCELSMADRTAVVELVDIERMPDGWSQSPQQKLENSELLKNSGAVFMKNNDFRRACKAYQLVQDFLGYVNDWAQDERNRADALRRACKSNEVLAWIKLEQFRDAADLCTELLEGGGGTGGNPKDLKALYRRGLAQLGMGDTKLAKSDFQQVLAEDPKNHEARAQLLKAKELEKEQSKNSGDLFKGMIGAAGSFGYPTGFTSMEGEREREREAMMDRLEELKAKGPLVI